MFIDHCCLFSVDVVWVNGSLIVSSVDGLIHKVACDLNEPGNCFFMLSCLLEIKHVFLHKFI